MSDTHTRTDAPRAVIQNETGVPFDVAAHEQRDRELAALGNQVNNAESKLERAKADVTGAERALAEAKAALDYALSPVAVAAHEQAIADGIALNNRTPAEKAEANLAALRREIEWAEQALTEAQAAEADD